MTQMWYQMKGVCLIYHISTKSKQNNHPLTNYCHFSNRTRQMYIRTKNYVYLFTVFYNLHVLNDKYRH